MLEPSVLIQAVRPAAVPAAARGNPAPARPEGRSLIGGVVAQLLRRQRTLCLYGFGMLALAMPLLALDRLDPRLLHGVGVWDKPIRFCVSTGVFALTACWFFGYVRPERRRGRRLRWMARLLVLSSGFEVAWVGWQGAHGLDSHFNISSPFYGAMFALMGVFALLLVCTSLPLAWEIGRRPAVGVAPGLAASVVAGLVLSTVLASVTGYAMAAHLGHTVGATGGGMPLFGWNRSGGDLRVAHFLGVHAEQAIPLATSLLLRLRRLPERALAGTTTVLYAAITLATLAQALAGQPIRLPL